MTLVIFEARTYLVHWPSARNFGLALALRALSMNDYYYY